MIRALALGVGFIILMQGLLGLSLPDPFVGLVGSFQHPPVLYIAGGLRIAFGAILFLAAPHSRTPIALRVIGAILFVGGILTPIIGIAFAESILAWWKSGGPAIVRMWAAVALLLGCFIIYALQPRKAQ